MKIQLTNLWSTLTQLEQYQTMIILLKNSKIVCRIEKKIKKILKNKNKTIMIKNKK